MLKYILKLIYPDNYSCYICGNDVFDNPHLVCDDCLKTLPFLTGNLCNHCSEPIKSEGNYCKRCKGKKFIFDKALAPFSYKDEIKNLILGLKYKNKKFNAKCLASFMSDLILKNNITADVIITVPLCSKRLKKRGYNQSLLLAKEISKSVKVDVREDILMRVKETPTQTNLDYAERQDNLKDAFKIRNSKLIKNKVVLLIDDVYTTGATVRECSKVLKKAGVSKIYVITVAHTLLDNE